MRVEQWNSTPHAFWQRRYLRTAVEALAVTTTSMERIAISRVTVLLTHRSFCESNRLLAEGERLRADARKYGAGVDAIAGARRATSPREIDTAMQPYDLTFEDEAIIAMREVERRSLQRSGASTKFAAQRRTDAAPRDVIERADVRSRATDDAVGP